MRGSGHNQCFWAPATWDLGTLMWEEVVPSLAVLVLMSPVTTAVPREEKSLPRLQRHYYWCHCIPFSYIGYEQAVD